MSEINHFLNLFFNPRSVAIVGATRNVDTLNYHLLANLTNLKFPGKIYPVNPNSKEILGIKTYPDVKSIEGDVDLAVISIPASKTLSVIHDCIAKRVKGVVLIPGGFAEIGERGKKFQNEIRNLLRDNGIRAMGPNTLGPINASNNFSVSFRAINRIVPGRLSLIFQSGLWDPRINWLLSEFNLYISKLIDLGNKMDINEVDALQYLAQDPETGVIAMHLESIAGDARTFVRLLRETSREKPVIVLKSGRTEAGARAAASHTGAMVREKDYVFDAVLKQTGAVRAQTLDDLWDLAKVFEYLRPILNNRVHVATGPGGEGVLTTDLCQLNGLTMASMSPETYAKLRSIFPPWDISVNPFDIGVCSQFNDVAQVFRVLLEALANDENVDCAALQVRVGQIKDPEPFLRLASGVTKRGKPLVIWMVVMPKGDDTIVQKLESNRIPVYPSAERAIKALSALYRYGTRREELRKQGSG